MTSVPVETYREQARARGFLAGLRYAEGIDPVVVRTTRSPAEAKRPFNGCLVTERGKRGEVEIVL